MFEHGWLFHDRYGQMRNKRFWLKFLMGLILPITAILAFLVYVNGFLTVKNASTKRGLR